MELQDTKPRWGLLLGILLLLAGVAAVPFFFLRPSSSGLPAYEIRNFIGKAEIYSHKQGAWLPLKRGDFLEVKDKLRTGPGAEVDFQVPNQIQLRLKENSELEVQARSLLGPAKRYRLYLVKGTLLGATEKDYPPEQLEISTPVLVAAVRGTSFQIQFIPETQKSIVRVLKGAVSVRSIKTRKTVVVKALEQIEVEGSAIPGEPVRVDRKEWEQLREAYELLQLTSAVEAKQLDLSKSAGNLFQYVFDQGSFFTPKLGHAERVFIKDEATGETHLKIDYDVFPVGSFVGAYMKTRGIDLSHYKGLSFQIRGDQNQGFPDSFRIEFKVGYQMIRVFVPRDFKTTWQTVQFAFQYRKPTPISEVAFVFANDKVGNRKSGTIYLKDFNLLAADQQTKP